MLMYLSNFFQPKEVVFYSYNISNGHYKGLYMFEDDSYIKIYNDKVEFFIPNVGSLSVIDTNLVKHLLEIMKAPQKYIPHLIAGAIKLFAINTGLIDYDFEDGDVRDVILFLGA